MAAGIRAGSEVCGYVTSGGYGHRIDASVAYGYLPAALGPGSEVEISLFDRWVPARVVAEPLYDPAGERTRGSAHRW